MSNKIKKGLYFITDRASMPEEDFLKLVNEVCSEGLALIQLREKNISYEEFLSLAKKVKKIADKYSTQLIIDDNVNLAKELSCGVHLGAEDMSIEEARKILGPDTIIGATAKSLERAREAESQGADYLGVGAIYPTTTHVKTKITSVDSLKEIIDGVEIPVYAIGGLREDNLEILKSLKLHGICVVSRIMKADNPKEMTRLIKLAMDQILWT